MKKGPFGRPIRTPIGTRDVLTAPKKAGFVRRFVNDEGDRVKQFEEAGYTIVQEDIEVGDPKAGKDTPTGSVVSKSVGAGTKAVLMEIKEEWYKEDQKAKQDRISMAENDMKRRLKSGHGGLYPTSASGLRPEDTI